MLCARIDLHAVIDIRQEHGVSEPGQLCGHVAQLIAYARRRHVHENRGAGDIAWGMSNERVHGSVCCRDITFKNFHVYLA